LYLFHVKKMYPFPGNERTQLAQLQSRSSLRRAAWNCGHRPTAVQASSSPPAMSAPPVRTLADLDGDVLAHCAGYLGARDVASLSMCCRPLRAAAYCDAVWYRLFRSWLWRSPLVYDSESGIHHPLVHLAARLPSPRAKSREHGFRLGYRWLLFGLWRWSRVESWAEFCYLPSPMLIVLVAAGPRKAQTWRGGQSFGFLIF